MKEVVEVTSPPLQAKCLSCGKVSEPFQQTGETEVEKSSIPFGVLAEASWSRSGGIPFKKDEINILPSICPACQELGFTLEMYGEVGPLDWYKEE